MKRFLIGGLLLASSGLAMAQAAPPELHWDPGAEDCDISRQRTEAQAIDATTIAIRQNPCVDYEAPLMYLLIGEERALLIDSGATSDPRLTAELTALVEKYLIAEDGTRLPLVVAHTHGHQDHRGGDLAFIALPDTTVVPVDGDRMRAFFQLERWPDYWAEFDLGHRRVHVIPTPGHHEDHIVFVDEQTSLLFSGDFMLPGRLLVDDADAYLQSVRGMGNATAELGITYAMGAHIEMNRRHELYASGATWHPNERQVAIKFETQENRWLWLDLEEFNGFYLKSGQNFYVLVNPKHNLIALMIGVLLAIVLLVWGARRLLKARRRETT